MKKIALGSGFLFLFLFCNSQTEDWRPIRTDDTYYYETISGIRAIRIDSIQENENCTELYGHNEMSSFNWDCYTPFGSPWFSDKTINYQDCTIIRNKEKEVFIIKHLAKNGESWLCNYDTVNNDSLMAEVIELGEMEIFDDMDSIKIISLIGNNDNIELIISKNYGFIKLISFKIFRIDELIYPEEYYFDAELVGIENLNKGITNITTLDIFNFEVGDELHTTEYYWDYESPSVTRKNIEKIIDKTVTDSLIAYSIERCRSHGIDTFKFELNKYKTTTLDYLPFESILVDNEAKFTRMGFYYDGRTSKSSWDWFGSDGDSCYHMYMYDKKNNEDYYWQMGYFVEGLGGRYYEFSGFSISSRTLVYFKKTNKEWGNPHNCDEILSKNEIVQKSKIQIYPNPANEYVHIENSEPQNDYSVQFYNLLGEKIYGQRLDYGLTLIDTKLLQKGWLFFKITEKNKIIKTGKIVVQY